MSSITDEAFRLIVGRNLLWMIGNVALAWAGVLFLWTCKRWSTYPRVCGGIVIACAAGLVFSRMRPSDGFDPSPLVYVGALALAAVAALWVWRAMAGDRWAMWLAVVGAIAFAPNAPYVLTDGMHYVQDVRATDLAFGPAFISALIYGWFWAVSLAAWIILLDIAREHIAPHRRATALLAVSAIVAAGIYMGRIVRVNSWELVTDPQDVFSALADVFTDRGPALFTVIWTIVVLATSWIGLRSARAHHGEALRAVSGWAWLLSGALLIGMPGIALFDGWFDLSTPDPPLATVIGALATGTAFGALGLRQLHVLRLPERRTMTIAAATVLVFGPLLILGSTLGWWAQYRSLCHYGPDKWLHRERCVTR